MFETENYNVMFLIPKHAGRLYCNCSQFCCWICWVLILVQIFPPKETATLASSSKPANFLFANKAGPDTCLISLPAAVESVYASLLIIINFTELWKLHHCTKQLYFIFHREGKICIFKESMDTFRFMCWFFSNLRNNDITNINNIHTKTKWFKYIFRIQKEKPDSACTVFTVRSLCIYKIREMFFVQNKNIWHINIKTIV